MTTTIALTVFLAAAGPELPPLPTPTRDVDYRVRRLHDKEVRADKDRLAAALDDLWKMLPPPGKPLPRHRQGELAAHLVPFITLESPKEDPREGLVGRDTGWPVYSMLLHIGMPAVPALLGQLRTPGDTPAIRNHREWVARCLVEIYAEGGDGRRMAVERIKLYAESHPPAVKQRILSALEFTVLKPSPPPVDPVPKK
jgi:hypothetical protein